MAQSDIKNYLYIALEEYQQESCSPIKGQIYNNFHCSENASIGLYLSSDNESSTNIKKLSDTHNDSSIYIFNAEDFPEQSFLQNLNSVYIQITENPNNVTQIKLNVEKIKQALLYGQNTFIKFSYNINDENCKQFDNCIMYIEQKDSSDYTYINWISPIASGNDIIPYIPDTNTTFIGDTSKCIKATSPTTWESSFKKNQDFQVLIENYHGEMNSITSKSYVKNNLVRFQDISLNSITSQHTVQPSQPGSRY